MPQNLKTGRQGRENGYKNANEIGALLGAARIFSNSNEFRWNNKVVVIKTGSSAVVTRAMLARVTAIVYGKKKNSEWKLYEIDPKEFEKLSIQSSSRNHNENYRLVRRTQIREHGREIHIPMPGTRLVVNMKKGIIETEKNPFVNLSWIEQGYGLTYKKKRCRQEDLPNLFDRSIDEINKMDQNEGKYLAFVAIRWGFAEIHDNKLIPTKIWKNRFQYDEYGIKLQINRTA